MRAVRRLLPGLALLAAATGCATKFNYTAGVCDCYPPNVESVLVAPARSGPMCGSLMPAAMVVAAPVSSCPGGNCGPNNAAAPNGVPTYLPPANHAPAVNHAVPGNAMPAGTPVPALTPVPLNNGK